MSDDLTRLRAVAERANLPKQPCGVCMGHSPEWDGHAAGCGQPLRSAFDAPTLLALIDRSELDALRAAVTGLADDVASRLRALLTDEGDNQ